MYPFEIFRVSIYNKCAANANTTAGQEKNCMAEAENWGMAFGGDT